MLANDGVACFLRVFLLISVITTLLSLVSSTVAVIPTMASPADLPGQKIPTVTVEAFLLDLHAAKAVALRELELCLETCKWILVDLDLEKNQIAHRSDWACLCVSLFKACKCIECQDQGLLKELQFLGLNHLAPMHSLGSIDIQKLTGTPLKNVKARELCDLHAFIHKHSLVHHFPWLEGVQVEIQTLHVDLTGEWNTDLMT